MSHLDLSRLYRINIDTIIEYHHVTDPGRIRELYKVGLRSQNQRTGNGNIIFLVSLFRSNIQSALSILFNSIIYIVLCIRNDLVLFQNFYAKNFQILMPKFVCQNLYAEIVILNFDAKTVMSNFDAEIVM